MNEIADLVSLQKNWDGARRKEGASRIGRGWSGNAFTPPSPTPTVNFARTPAMKVVRSTTTSTPSSKKGVASQGVVVEFQWNSSAARTL